MPFVGPYVCSKCGAKTEREDLTVLRLSFLTMGTGPKVKKSRTLGWLCENCIEIHPLWNLDKFEGPPYRLTGEML